MGKRVLMHAVRLTPFLALPAVARPPAAPSLGNLNHVIVPFVVATIAGGVIFKLSLVFGDHVAQATGNRAHGKWLMALGAAVWIGLYVVAFLM